MSVFRLAVLVVGESHYAKPEEAQPGLSIDCIESLIDGRWRNRFFSNIQRCFTGEREAPSHPRAFWSSVSFFNYIQEALVGPGDAPTEAMWEGARPAFRAVLSALQPACVLFVCKRLFQQIKPEYAAGPVIRSGDLERETIFIDIGPEKRALASYILHPTYRGWRNQRPWVIELVRQAGGEVT